MIKYCLAIILMMFSFSPSQVLFASEKLAYEKLAKAEIASWKAYYKKDKIAILTHLMEMFELQFAINNTLELSALTYQFASAALEFSSLSFNTPEEDYQQKVLPKLSAAYESLKKAIGAEKNKKKVAEKEMKWWMARRFDETNRQEDVGEKMAELFSEIYGYDDNDHFKRAGYLRASAARYRDLCHRKWGEIEAFDWDIIETILSLCYKEVNKGIKINEILKGKPLHPKF